MSKGAELVLNLLSDLLTLKILFSQSESKINLTQLDFLILLLYVYVCNGYFFRY